LSKNIVEKLPSAIGRNVTDWPRGITGLGWSSRRPAVVSTGIA